MTAPGVGDAWAPIVIREVRIVTAAVAGRIHVRGVECAYLIRDESGVVPDIAVQNTADLREALPALRPARIYLDCADGERQALTELVHLVMLDRRVVEALH